MKDKGSKTCQAVTPALKSKCVGASRSPAEGPDAHPFSNGNDLFADEST